MRPLSRAALIALGAVLALSGCSAESAGLPQHHLDEDLPPGDYTVVLHVVHVDGSESRSLWSYHQPEGE